MVTESQFRSQTRKLTKTFSVNRLTGMFTFLLTIQSLLVVVALAQDYQLQSLHGSVELDGNFGPDPYIVNLTAGGFNDAGAISSDCVGYISEAPSFEFEFNNPLAPIGIFVISNADTTLVINDPAGQWHCNDDFLEDGDTSPGLNFEYPLSGIYDIWVGSYSTEDNLSSAELYLVDLDPRWEDQTTIENSNGNVLPNSSGTGFVVSSSGHILTNNHVIESCSRLFFQLRGDIAVQAMLIDSNQGADLALLQADVDVEPAKFNVSQSVRLGEEVVVYGFPLLGDLSSQGNLTDGIVSALSGLNDDLGRMQMTAQIQPGNSGGPVMNRSGHVVGVVVETANDEYFREQRGASIQNLNFAIRDSIARTFLDTNNIDYHLSDSSAILSVADIADSAQNFTGIILCYQ